jgi:hypothetical protein
MVDPSMLVAVELTLNECAELLAAAPPGPAARELRVRHGALSRVVGGWRVNPPHLAQLSAMLECTMELRAMVVRLCEPLPQRDPATLPGLGPRTSSRPPRSTTWPRRAQRTTRPPQRDMSTRTTRPPPRRRPNDG